MRYGSVCSGIEAATVAWHPLGWEPAFFSEIEAAPKAVLAHHWPDVPCHGDFTTIRGDEYGAIDLLVGGTPCQDFSIAGLRAGLDGDRGNLSLEFLRLADRTRPRWVVWENVPGVLSIDGGRAFGAILGGLGELGYGFAYRVLDAQFFGVPQRRRRVFVVGCAGDWRGAAAVLSERHSLSGHPAPRAGALKAAAALTSNGVGTCGADDNQAQAGHLVAQAFGGNDTRGPIDVATALNSHGGPHGRQDFESETFVLMERGRDGVPNLEWRNDGTANAILTPNGGRGGLGVGAVCTPAIAFDLRNGTADTTAMSIQAGGMGDDRGLCPNAIPHTLTASAVRRLTPRECERLQGFPDDRNTVTIRVCQDEEEKRAIASSVPQSSTALSHDRSAPVLARVLIDLERPGLQLLSHDGSRSIVSDAADESWSARPMPAGEFVRLAALMTRSLARATRAGRAASLRSIRGFSPLWNGSASVLLSGAEISGLASDAEQFTAALNRCSTFTMSEAGPVSPTCEQTLEILSCCVASVIAGCIPKIMSHESSYAIQIEVVGGYTLAPHRGKPMADGPRYKALGNSMAVPVMRWIGERIAAVDALMIGRAAA